MKNSPLARQGEIIIQNSDGEFLIYDLRANKVLSLNHTSTMVWKNCDGNNSVGEIASKMTSELGEKVSEDLVWLALEGLKKQSLIENEITLPFDRVSRREVIRRIGTASLVALPVIVSLVAPSAVHAQSTCPSGPTGRPLGCPCTLTSQCQPPATRCCLDSLGAPNNMTCVVVATQISNGGACGNACSCISNCCASGVCAPSRTVAPGVSCTTACQCASGTCLTGLCA